MRNLKPLRLEKGLSQLAMAHELHMPQSTYQQYEAGITEPRYATLIRIADYFDVSIDYLIGRTNIRDSWDRVDDRVIGEIALLRNPKARRALLVLLREIRRSEK